jgi:hypothetical protein
VRCVKSRAAAEIEEPVAVETRSKFREALPRGCPPPDAAVPSKQIVYRLTLCDPPTQRDFDSSAARGRPLRLNDDACCHSSCSVAVACDRGRQRLADLSNLPFYKRKRTYIAHIAIDSKSGSIKVTHNSAHVDLWMFSTFDPVSATIKSEEIR